MKTEEQEINNEQKNDNNNINNEKEKINITISNDNISEENIKLDNEILSSIFKNPPILEKKYQNEELNNFKDDILQYLSERNHHYMSLIKYFQDKIEEGKKEYNNQINSISQNYSSILSSQASLNNKIDKISNFELFINRTNDQLITHEIRINNLSTDFIKSTQKYDKIYLENLELPGYIGKFAKYKNCQVFFDSVIRELDKFNQYKEKNNLEIKSYKEKLDGVIKSFHTLIKNNDEAQMKYIKQLNDKCVKECKNMNDLLSNRVCDLRIENAKCSMDLIKKSDEMNKEWKKILEIKDNLLNLVHEKINNFKNIFLNNVASFNNFKKEYEEFKIQINDIVNYYKELKNENNNINFNLNNNSYNNYAGCFINSGLPLDKKNWKYFSKKFSKKSRSKTKYLSDKKNFVKSTSALNSNRNNIKNEELNNLENDAVKIEDNNVSNLKEKETRKRNYGNSLNKEKTIPSIDKYKNKYNIENISRKNVFGFKEPRSSKNVAKIEINSHIRINGIDSNKKEENKNRVNEEKNLNIKKLNLTNNNSNDFIKEINNEPNSAKGNSISIFSADKNQEKENIIFNAFKNNKKSLLHSNKTTQSEDLDNNISNFNIGNSNISNNTNDNFSLYSINSGSNVNKFVLNEGLLDANDHVIKELASELEQSTNKKDKLASNKKKIEDNFKVICNKISPLNFNKTESIKETLSINENEINENTNKNNSEEKSKINLLSSEKKEENKTKNINGNQNEYKSLNKKMELFDKKLFNLESLLKEKIIEILIQMDNLQNMCYYGLNKKKVINQKLNNNINNLTSVNLTMNNNLNSNMMNRNISNDFINNNNLITQNCHDDYYINCNSIKKIAPIIEINPENLQLSPSPSKTQNFIGKKSKDQGKTRAFKIGETNNFKDIKIFKKNENKENIKPNNNIDNWDLSQLGKNGNFFGVNKWINLNRLIKMDQLKNSTISNNGGLLANGNFDIN